ncbi:MAG: peptide-methionine (R)-S-oxide reductase MsrB [Candidatus Baltobacteraceae bacterium]
MADQIEKTDAEWRQQLGPSEFAVLREAATEPAFSGALLHNHDTGMYRCGACDTELFDSKTKFESGSGWPSFYEPAQRGTVELRRDATHGMERIEAACARCGSHLGHVFDDGPAPTGQRFCLNSLALTFDPAPNDDEPAQNEKGNRH